MQYVVAIFKVEDTKSSNEKIKELLKVPGFAEAAQGETAQMWMDKINNRSRFS